MKSYFSMIAPSQENSNPELEELALELGIPSDELQAYLLLEEERIKQEKSQQFQERNQERNLDINQDEINRMY